MPDQLKQPDGTVVDPTRTQTAQQQDQQAHPTGLTHEFGLLSQLPANGSRVDNSTFFATDQNGGTPYRMVGGVWVQSGMGVAQAGGAQLARANFTLTSQNFTIPEADMTGMVITFTVAQRPVDVVAFVPVAAQNTAGGQLLLKITDNANTEKSRCLISVTTQVVGASPLRCEEQLITPGTYTRKIRFSNNNAGGTCTVYGTATGPQFNPYIAAYER